jgi:hypothetical protein
MKAAIAWIIIAYAPAEIRTEQLPAKSQGRYRYPNLFGFLFIYEEIIMFYKIFFFSEGKIR